MAHKVICRSHPDGCSDCGVYEDENDAYDVYFKHYALGHDVGVYPVGRVSDPDKDENIHSTYLNSPFRISKSVATRDFTRSREEPISVLPKILSVNDNDTKEEEKDNRKYNYYFEKLIKLVPAEVVGIYLVLYPLGKNADGSFSSSWGFWISIICFILVFISRVFGTKVTGYSTMRHFKTAQWGSIVIASVSFIIWVYAMGHTFAGFEIKEQRIIQAAVVLWTFVVPIFYKGDE